MAASVVPSQTVQRLVGYLLDGAAEDPLTEELVVWCTHSARFRVFAEVHRDKIRKKLRSAPDADARRDVRAELRVAQLLLAERRISLAFEAYGSGNRGPDFTVTLGGDRFNIEVTRLRGDPAGGSFGGLLAKVRQLPPSIANGVALVIEGDDAGAYDVAAVVASLRARADAKDDALFTARGFDGSRGFKDRFARLGAVFIFAEEAAGAARATVWTNANARIAFPGRANRACLACLRSGSVSGRG